MGFSKLGAEIWRNYVTDGVAASGVHDVVKADMRAWMLQVEGLTAGAFSNHYRPAGANYTISTYDAGGTVFVTASSPTTVTFLAASNYAATHATMVVNLGTRGVRIVIPGWPDLWIYQGQFVMVLRADTAWYRTTPGRKLVESTLRIYVDPISGSDTLADGLATGSGAFRSINGGASALINRFDHQNRAPYLELADGAYEESLTLSGQITGYNVMFLRGQTAEGVTWRPGAGNYCLIVGDNAECIYQNILYDNADGTSGATAVTVHQTGVIDQFSGCAYGAFPGGTHVALDGAGGTANMTTSYRVLGDFGNHINIGGGGGINYGGGITVSIPSALTFTNWLRLALPGWVNMAATTFSGAGAGSGSTGKKYEALLNSAISLGGNTLPGATAGTATFGAQAA